MPQKITAESKKIKMTMSTIVTVLYLASFVGVLAYAEYLHFIDQEPEDPEPEEEETVYMPAPKPKYQTVHSYRRRVA